MKKVYAALACMALFLSSCVRDDIPVRSVFNSAAKCRIMLWDERNREVYVPPTEFSVNGGWGELTGRYWREGDSLTAVALMPSSENLNVDEGFGQRGLVWTDIDFFDEDVLWAQERGLTNNGEELQFRHLSSSLVSVEASLKSNRCTDAKARVSSLSLNSLSKDVRYGMYLDDGSEYAEGKLVSRSIVETPSAFVKASQEAVELWSGEVYLFPQFAADDQFVTVDLVWEYYLGTERVSTYTCSGRRIPASRGKKLRLKLILNPDEGKVTFGVVLLPWEHDSSNLRNMEDVTSLIEIEGGEWINAKLEEVNY